MSEFIKATPYPMSADEIVVAISAPAVEYGYAHQLLILADAWCLGTRVGVAKIARSIVGAVLGCTESPHCTELSDALREIIIQIAVVLHQLLTLHQGGEDARTDSLWNSVTSALTSCNTLCPAFRQDGDNVLIQKCQETLTSCREVLDKIKDRQDELIANYLQSLGETGIQDLTRAWHDSLSAGDSRCFSRFIYHVLDEIFPIPSNGSPHQQEE
jgi:hypothetical protein